MLCPIGQGACGQVWLARNVLGTLRAVKVLYRQDFGDSQPFDREFKAIQKFEPISRSHPGVVDILQIGRNDTEGYFYYVMELADPTPNPKSEVRNPREARKSKSGTENAWCERGSARIPTAGGGAESPANPKTESRTANAEAENEVRASDLGLLSGFGPRSSDFYAPRTLRSDLKARGRLPFDECLNIGLALTSALEHLHAHGLVHRDVKPSNIIFVEGQPKLADIGLVAGVDEARSFVGTQGFIPPEGPGKPQADLYSLGIVLYVMSTGKRHDAFPEPLTDLADDPDHERWLELNAIIHQACEVDPRDRYQSAAKMRADLLRLQAGKSVRSHLHLTKTLKWASQTALLVAVALALVAAIMAFWPRESALVNSVPAKPQPLFVLPFRSPPGDTVSEELAGRVTDALIDSLGVILGPDRVGPRKSGWLAKNDDEARRVAFADLNAREAVEGRVSVVNNQMEVVLTLYTTPTGPPVWTRTFTGTTNAMPDLEWLVIEGLAQGLSAEIPDVVRSDIMLILTNNLAALGWCRKGWEFQRSFSVPNLTSAKEAFLRATELDPNYVGAHFGVLWVCRVSYDRSYRDVWPDVRSRARLILQIDDTHWNTRYYLAWARILHDYDWEGGMRDLESVLQERNVDPGEWAIYYRAIGRMDEARIAQEQDDALGRPRGVLLWHSGAGKYLEGRHDDAVQIARKVQQAEPESHIGFLIEAWGQLGKRDYRAALEAVQRGLSLQERQDLHGLLGYVYARMGETNQARGVLEELQRLAYAQPYWVARIYAALGETGDALTWLEKAYEDRSELLVQADIGMGGLRMDQAWNGLRGEPRFQELLRKTGMDKWPK
jgi:serine/threonine protein kinase